MMMVIRSCSMDLLIRVAIHISHLVLPSLEQSLSHLVLFDDVDVCTPAGKGISINGVKKGL